jgi:hypothetical protein
MTINKTTLPIVQIGLWLVILLVFAIGFWHTHLGLKEMKPFGAEWGSLAIAGILLLPILITYWYAVNGKKMALIFYVFYGIFFFVCNLNYFYPAYIARQIVKEEAIALNDTLQNYANQAKSLQNHEGFGNKTKELLDYENLKIYKAKVVTEIKSIQFGWGTEASKAFNGFNEISREYGFPVEKFSNAGNMTQQQLSATYEKYLESTIQKVLETMISNVLLISKGSNALSFIKGVAELDTLQKNYATVLGDSIIPDNSEINLEDVKTHPQIIILHELATGINDATSKINSATKSDSFKFQTVEEPQSRNLGRIAFTFQSIKDRNTKVETWVIIFLCLFVNLILPLTIYPLLLKKEVILNKPVK